MGRRKNQHRKRSGTHAKPSLSIDFYQTAKWKKLRLRVLARDNATCFYCDGVAIQADHVLPRKRGGADSMDNLVACCPACNGVALNLVFDDVHQKRLALRQMRGLSAFREVTPLRARILAARDAEGLT